jgi:hypothetical protein
MNHASRTWAGGGLFAVLLWAGNAGAQECVPGTKAGCDEGQCVEYTCSAAPLKRGFCEGSVGRCPPGTPDGTPCDSGGTCRTHHTILGFSSEDGGGFACETTISYCQNAPAVPETGGTHGVSSLGLGGSRSSTGTAATGAAPGRATGGVGGAPTGDTGSDEMASGGTRATADPDPVSRDSSTSNESSCAIGRRASGQTSPLAAAAILALMAARRPRRLQRTREA